MFKKTYLSFLFILSVLFSFGQIEDPSEKVSWEISYEQVNCEVTLIAKVTMAEHWHISASNLPLDCFSIPTSITISDHSDYDVQDSTYEPKPIHLYDSLIDASKIVGEQSSIKEGLKSGNLQTQIIDAISKNLDDQTKLKRQIDAAVLKGEIEKDIYQAKGGSSSEQLIKALAESGNLTEQEVARSRLGLPINVSQAIQVASAAKKGAPLTHDDVVLAATNFAALDNKPIKQQISSDEVKDKVGSGKQFANELAVVEAALGANPTAADDGFYIIGTKLIEVVKGKPIPRN